MSLTLEGVIGPVVTTFRARSEDLDLTRFVANIKAHLAAGLSGIVVCGSTGEAALLDEEERLQALEAARRQVPEERLLLMGAGAESTRLTVRRCREAQTVGADGVLVVAPHYYAGAMTAAALRAHFRSVADDSPLPVVLYNIPKYMHFKLPIELVMELAQHPNVVGIKDSSGDLDLLRGYLGAQSESFTVLTGNGGTFHAALVSGARGGILAVALFAPELCVSLYQAHQSGQRAAAEALQAKLQRAAVEVVGELGVPGVKAAMDAVGLCGGPVRGPLLDLDHAGRDRVAALLEGLQAAVV
ncbi:MAG TPA: dihydrodipicolinate synthase family protein [Gemmatimonadaceae bacterium]|uniref:Putative dihydrodipicolinate synthetase n=1 Tax=uncultured Gemmatimonadetes bacterium Rifle_16ft_4_minimus_37772 TaxID=1665097 RepID=A0A0H4T4Y5_9BACT|nr:putative dihydrodipicolinate synthetase [uncultured Gemmatimonadetes bacterium Rifle_16ft_4_minimus_37772]HLA90104.1 dihydrodipicolinate synthase family protein [Gemmatimonadaceae bacterium]